VFSSQPRWPCGAIRFAANRPLAPRQPRSFLIQPRVSEPQLVAPGAVCWRHLEPRFAPWRRRLAHGPRIAALHLALSAPRSKLVERRSLDSWPPPLRDNLTKPITPPQPPKFLCFAALG